MTSARSLLLGFLLGLVFGVTSTVWVGYSVSNSIERHQIEIVSRLLFSGPQR